MSDSENKPNRFVAISKKLSNSELEYRLENPEHFQHNAIIAARNELLRRGAEGLPPVPKLQPDEIYTPEEKEELRLFEELMQGKPASFMDRALAVIIDTFICLVSLFTIFIVLAIFDMNSVSQWLLNKNLVQIVFFLSYYVFWETSQFQATPGKRILRIKVVDQNGNRIEGVRSGLRYFSKFLSFITFLLGYLMMFFDLKKRTLHDRITKTHVIKPENLNRPIDDGSIILDQDY